jgi:hypothetical protein
VDGTRDIPLALCSIHAAPKAPYLVCFDDHEASGDGVGGGDGVDDVAGYPLRVSWCVMVCDGL